MLTRAQLQHFKTQGYVLLDNAVPENLLQSLREATNRVTQKARRKDWPHVRRAGEDDIWGVSHLLHPHLGEPIFAEYIASPIVIDVVGDLLGVAPENRPAKLQLELVNMLVNPAEKDHEIGWHRDLIRTDLPPEKERAELRKLQYGVQWNTALYDETCLLIVPASHLRPKTPEERDIVFNRPKDPMPRQMAVELKAGQGVYYNANLLHRGVYPKAMRRETLHCCMGVTDGALLRTHLYTGLAWMDRPGFRETLPAPLVPLYNNFLQMMAAFEALPEKPRRK